MAKEVWLIRHAESASNAGEKTKSTATNPITDKGWDQATMLKDYLLKKAPSPDLIVTSPFIRTKQTAQPFVDHWGISAIECAVQEFTYLNAELYANTSVTDRIPARGVYWARNDPNYTDGGGAESFNDLIFRAKDAIDFVVERPEKTIMIFSHGWFIKTIWWLIQNNQLNKGQEDNLMARLYKFLTCIEFPNTGILRLDIRSHDDIRIRLDRVPHV
jgi:2,3-bisphosphoglycerate-dependent phosphoglycerate mutase